MSPACAEGPAPEPRAGISDLLPRACRWDRRAVVDGVTENELPGTVRRCTSSLSGVWHWLLRTEK